jgi:CheY-like chemotaxis protein
VALHELAIPSDITKVPYTLLLADDSLTIQRVIELTFADEDVQVIAVSDGDQAIERLDSAAPPDIVLADIGMPGRNGYEVAQYIRQTPRLAHIPVMLLTGAFEPVDQARAAEAGCDGVLAKPFEPQLVIGRVKELLARTPHSSAPIVAGLPSKSAPADQLPPIADHAFSAHGSGPAEQQPIAPGELNDYFDRLDAAFSTLTPGTPAPPPATSVAPMPAPSSMSSPSSSASAPGAEIDWFGFVPGGGAATPPWDLRARESVREPADPPLSYPSLQPPAAPFPPPAAVASPEPHALDASFAPAAPLAPVASFAAAAPSASDSSFAVAAPSVPHSPFAAAAPAAHPAPDASLAPAALVAATSAPAQHSDLPPLADAFAALLAAEQSGPLTSIAPAWPVSVKPAAAVTDEMIESVTRRVLERLSDTVVRETIADIVSKVAEQLVRQEIERIKASIK